MMRLALRATLAALALGGLACSGGGPKPTGQAVRRFDANGYRFEYDGEQKRVTLGAEFIRMVRHPEDIEVSGGTLRVGPRDYGAVAKGDLISVVGGKVAVNGRERPPTGLRAES